MRKIFLYLCIPLCVANISLDANASIKPDTEQETESHNEEEITLAELKLTTKSSINGNIITKEIKFSKDYKNESSCLDEVNTDNIKLSILDIVYSTVSSPLINQNKVINNIEELDIKESDNTNTKIESNKAEVEVETESVNNPEVETESIIKPEVETEAVINSNISQEEINYLAQCVFAEAGNQDNTGKRLIVDVILNRLNLNKTNPNKFANNIIDIINTPNQFEVVSNHTIYSSPITDEILTIISEELNNISNTEVLFFRTKNFFTWGTPLFQHGDHYFSK